GFPPGGGFRVRVEVRVVLARRDREHSGQRLIDLGQGAEYTNAWVEVGSETENNIFDFLIIPTRDCGEGRNVEITRDIQHPEVTLEYLIICLEFLKVRLLETGEIHRWFLEPIVPPQGHTIALHQLHEAL